MAVKHPTFISYLLMPGTKPGWQFRDRFVYERLFPREKLISKYHRWLYRLQPRREPSVRRQGRPFIKEALSNLNERPPLPILPPSPCISKSPSPNRTRNSLVIGETASYLDLQWGWVGLLICHRDQSKSATVVTCSQPIPPIFWVNINMRYLWC
jgi:hypothetical protein